MKKTLILAISLAGAAGAYAQGTVNFSTFVSGTLQVAIYAPQTGAAGTAEVTGNSSTDIPSGTTVYTGGTIGGASTGSGSTGYANGANFTAQLYALGGGASTAPFTSLSPVSQYVSTFFTVGAGAGYFRETAPANDPGIANTSGASAALAVAAWYSGGGALTLSAAKTANVPYGWSSTFVINNLGNVGGPPANPTPNLNGLSSFSLVTPVPEPATITLGIMGAAAFLARRRKQQ